MPKLGESIVSATIVTWLKREGDRVEIDEPLLEVSTDKVNSEIPSPVSGTLVKILAQVDETYDVDMLLCIIEAEGDQVIEQAVSRSCPSSGQTQDKSNFYSPAVLRFAKENNISMEELASIKGTGGGGRLSRKDIQNYLSEQGKSQAQSHLERVKMSGARKAIAEQMVKSFYEAPHASLVMEVDVTHICHYIEEEKQTFFEKHGYKLTITSYFIEAIAKAAQKFPYINASIDQDTIVLKKFVNVGIAVSVDQAVIVPVIRNADRLTTVEIAKQVADLANKAKNKQLAPDEVQGGTITMTNFGMGGAKIGIPIIRYPEVAIIGIGKLERQLTVLDDDSTAIRNKIHMSLTFDHRAIDGMYGCEFLSAVKHYLEQMHQ